MIQERVLHNYKMKKWLLVFLFLPAIGYSQIAISGLVQYKVAGTSGGGGTGVAIDTSYEVLAYAPIINVTYNPLRPNKQVTVPGTSNLSFFMNYVPNGFGGSVRFIYTTPPIVNGTVTTPFPTGPITVNKTYSEISSNPLLWN